MLTQTNLTPDQYAAMGAAACDRGLPRKAHLDDNFMSVCRNSGLVYPDEANSVLYDWLGGWDAAHARRLKKSQYRISEEAYEELREILYNEIMARPGMGMSDMGEAGDAAGSIVQKWAKEFLVRIEN